MSSSALDEFASVSSGRLDPELLAVSGSIAQPRVFKCASAQICVLNATSEVAGENGLALPGWAACICWRPMASPGVRLPAPCHPTTLLPCQSTGSFRHLLRTLVRFCTTASPLVADLRHRIPSDACRSLWHRRVRLGGVTFPTPTRLGTVSNHCQPICAALPTRLRTCRSHKLPQTLNWTTLAASHTWAHGDWRYIR